MVDLTENSHAESSSSGWQRYESSNSHASGSSSKAASSRSTSTLPSYQVASRHSAAPLQNEDVDAITPELDDYVCALMLQMSLLSEERHVGQLGKASADSDAQIAIELMLKEAAEVERSLALAKSLATCDGLPEELFEELDQEDNVAHSDRELVARLERGDDEAEHALEAATACLVDADDRDKYLVLKNEIENPVPPVAELDLAASRLISEKGWRVCDRCGAVVERVSGCVHMTCLCRNEFCYTCMKVWQTCNCEIYPAEELNQILDERVGNDDPGVVRHRLQNVLRNYYQHDHAWDRQLPLGRVCSVCRWAPPLYCLYCAGCMETRCHRCCYNN
ncbi:hypothetical protein BGZ72_001976 [Mortierella alpina]|nr:hypothetical protein BGZ72_001976 [Mortierella alpina]